MCQSSLPHRRRKSYKVVDVWHTPNALWYTFRDGIHARTRTYLPVFIPSQGYSFGCVAGLCWGLDSNGCFISPARVHLHLPPLVWDEGKWWSRDFSFPPLHWAHQITSPWQCCILSLRLAGRRRTLKKLYFRRIKMPPNIHYLSLCCVVGVVIRALSMCTLVFVKNIAFGRAFGKLLFTCIQENQGFFGLVPLVWHHVLCVMVLVLSHLEALLICFWINIHLLSHYIEDESWHFLALRLAALYSSVLLRSNFTVSPHVGLFCSCVFARTCLFRFSSGFWLINVTLHLKLYVQLFF